jgi:hypothetical protein
MLDLTSSISTVSKKKGNVRYASRTSIAGDAFQRFRLTPLLSHHVGMMVLAKSRRQSEAVALWFGQWAFYVETLYLLLSKKPRSDCAVSKGGRGKVNPTRQKAIAEGKKANIGERTMQAAVAKAEGRKPKKKPWRRTPVHSGLDAARRAYFKWCIDLDADLDAELDIIREAFREIAGKRAMDKNPPPTPSPCFWMSEPSFCSSSSDISGNTSAAGCTLYFSRHLEVMAYPQTPTTKR